MRDIGPPSTDPAAKLNRGESEDNIKRRRTTVMFQETWTVLMSRSILDVNLTLGNVGESKMIKK